jgi:hypothetical protein
MMSKADLRATTSVELSCRANMWKVWMVGEGLSKSYGENRRHCVPLAIEA